MDREQIIQTLDRWNFWHRKIDTGVKREFYLKKLLRYVSSAEIIALTGVRRSGKSTILLQLIEQLIQNGIPKENILYINFEDPIFEAKATLPFLQEIFNSFLIHFNPKGQLYLFLDEIQLVENWERFGVSLYDQKRKVKIFVTGSSSKLLKKEISTLLSGRFISEMVFPLNFKEFLQFKNVLYQGVQTPEIYHHLKEYLEFGGFPRIVLENDHSKKIKLLEEYYSSIVERDVITRNKIKNTREIKELLLFLLSNIGNQVSTYNIEKSLGIFNENVRRYFEYFQEAFLIDLVDFFSYKVKQQIYNPKKIYCVDSGLATIAAFKFSENKGKIMENVVFNHLKQEKKEIFYWKNKTEIDFVIRKGYKIAHIYNTCWSLKNIRTKDRELSSLEIGQKELHSSSANLVFWEKEDNFVDNRLINIANLLLL